MQDAHGRRLEKGDTVLIPATIDTLSEGEDYCNVVVETVHRRRPDGRTEFIGAINTGVLLRANEDDRRFPLDIIRGAVARGWCADANRSKEMDSDLAEAISQEVSKMLRF